MTFFFTLVWQFAQFILLLESMAFFGVYSLGFVPKHKVSALWILLNRDRKPQSGFAAVFFLIQFEFTMKMYSN